MAVTASTTIDGYNGTIVCNVLLNGSTVLDTLTYTNSNQQVSFPVRSSFTISAYDYIATLDIFTSFQQLIQNTVFSGVSVKTISNYSISTTQANDNVSQLTCVFQPGNHPLLSITCTYPNGTIQVNNRNQSAILNFDQWLYFLNTIYFYKAAIKTLYKI